MIAVRTEHGEESLTLGEFEGWVKTGRIAPHTPVRFPLLTGERWVDARELEVFRRLYEPARIYFRRSFRLGGVPAITTLVVVAEVLIFVAFGSFGEALSVDRLIALGAKTPPNVLELGETWRLFTANLLHRDVYHLAFNMLFLLNVGGTVENAYRRQDYVLILVVSAVFTTALSAVMSPLPSVGASGVVLGLFGASSVFGIKYAEILPDRYKKYFEWAVLPYALFLLYVGLATKDTDNWGHLGGMIGGSIAAVFLEPKLLHLCRSRGSFGAEHRNALVAAGFSALVLSAGPLLRAAQGTKTLAEPESGLEIEYPDAWTFGTNHLGYVSVGNSLGVSVGVSARRDERPVSLDELERTFVEVELGGQVEKGEITGLRVVGREDHAVRAFAEGDGAGKALPARRLRVELESRAGPMTTENLLVTRGRYAYLVVLAVPKAFAVDYAETLARTAASLQLRRPAPLGRAEAVVGEFPGMTSAGVNFAQELAAVGEIAAAQRVLDRLLAGSPEHLDTALAFIDLSVASGERLADAEALVARLHQEQPESPAIASRVADVALRRGHPDVARAALQATLELTPQAVPLRRRLFELSEGGR